MKFETTSFVFHGQFNVVMQFIRVGWPVKRGNASKTEFSSAGLIILAAWHRDLCGYRTRRGCPDAVRATDR